MNTVPVLAAIVGFTGVELKTLASGNTSRNN